MKVQWRKVEWFMAGTERSDREVVRSLAVGGRSGALSTRGRRTDHVSITGFPPVIIPVIALIAS